MLDSSWTDCVKCSGCEQESHQHQTTPGSYFYHREVDNHHSFHQSYLIFHSRRTADQSLDIEEARNKKPSTAPMNEVPGTVDRSVVCEMCRYVMTACHGWTVTLPRCRHTGRGLSDEDWSHTALTLSHCHIPRHLAFITSTHLITRLCQPTHPHTGAAGMPPVGGQMTRPTTYEQIHKLLLRLDILSIMC